MLPVVEVAAAYRLAIADVLRCGGGRATMPIAQLAAGRTHD
jgi:hypothetical protein